MSNSHRMRWRPAVGVLVLGGIAIGLTWHGASANRLEANRTIKAQKLGGPQIATPTNALTSRESLSTDSVPAKLPAPTVKTPGANANAVSRNASTTGITYLSPDDGFDPTLSSASIGRRAFGRAGAAVAVAGGGNGACCVAPSTCVNNTDANNCTVTLGGVHHPGESCTDDPCGFTVRACCDAAGACVGDQTRAACEGASGTWNPDASCVGASNLPLPVCNVYNVNNCSWDNGPYLNDGNNVRSHNHTMGAGQLPRYSFLAADDFILRGDVSQCELTEVRALHRQRAASGAQIPDPNTDWEGAAFTIYRDRIDPNTNFHSPAGYSTEPISADDENPKWNYSDMPGGVVYSRLWINGDANLIFTDMSAGACDPVSSFEYASVWEIKILVDPPIVLNKNVEYWMSLEGVFPFADGRNTLQSWAALSQNNTLRRAETFRTNNPAYYVGGDVVNGAEVWVPVRLNQSGGTSSPPQLGNAGNPAPCAGLPANTRFDLAWKLFGAKAANQLDADVCTAPATLVRIYDGYTAIDTTGATHAGPAASCGTPQQDFWYQYTSTCKGKLTVSTAGSSFDSIAVIYDGLGFSCAAPAGELACGNDELGDDASCFTAVDLEGVYYIRVGGIGAGAGKGVIQVLCEASCGNPTAADCCDADIECTTDADCPSGSVCGGPNPPATAGVCDYVLFGCTNETCCNAVCEGDAACCGANGGAWDDQCQAAAENEVVCGCPCTFGAHPGAVAEGESTEGNLCSTNADCGEGATCVDTNPDTCDCKRTTNAGCNTLPQPEAFQSIACGAVIHGKAWADGGFRDTDWYRFSLADADGEHEIVIETRSSIPIGWLLLSSNTDLDPATSFCLNSNKCSTSDNIICDEDADCPGSETCEQDPATTDTLDELTTGACLDRTMTVCVTSPGTYALVYIPQATNIDAGEEIPGDGIFDGFGCGTSNDYSFTMACNDACQPGACCTCLGACIEGITEAVCNAQLGTYKGEGSTCAGVGSCAADTHECAAATEIMCGQSVVVDLTADGLDPAPVEPSCKNGGGNGNGSAWYYFTATGTSARVNTCATPSNPGGDSILAVYSGTCCGTGANEFAEVGCNDDICGYNLFQSDVCLDNLTAGTTYYIQVMNWDDTVHGQYTLTVSCPCTGSCCNSATGACADNTAVENCQDTNEQFSSLDTCAELSPPCGFGACCNVIDGTCVDSIPPNCQTGDGTHNHFPGTTCARAICNEGGTCAFDNGVFDAADGFNCTYFADNGLFLDCADDFNLKRLPTSGDNNCIVDSVFWEVFTTSHDIQGGCSQGGGVNCADTAADYAGIIICISPDVEALGGAAKGPSCAPSVPVSPGGDGDYHEPLAITGAECICRVFGPAPQEPPTSGDYWAYIHDCEGGGQCEEDITAHFDPPIELDKNKKYWLSITHIWRETAGYSVIWGRSLNYNGNLLQTFNTTGAQEWTPQPDGDGVDNDFGFTLGGEKNLGCGSCQLFCDLVPGFCIVDVDDLICCLAGFANYPDCPQADVWECGNPNGLVDVDDLIALLGQFALDPIPEGCVDTCVPGGCILPSTECRDETYSPGGMSQTDCSALGGTYCGDYVLCGEAGCP